MNFNYQSHWAHQERTDDRRSPRDVLGWVIGRLIAPEELHRVFNRTRFGRKTDKLSGCPSPQLALWELDDTAWLKVVRRPDNAPRQPKREPAV